MFIIKLCKNFQCHFKANSYSVPIQNGTKAILTSHLYHYTLHISRDFSGVYVLLVSLFGIPIVQSISHFFGWLKWNLVYQKEIWSTKKEIWWTQKIYHKKNLVDQKNEKLTGQLVYQRDWPKVHGCRYSLYAGVYYS